MKEYIKRNLAKAEFTGNFQDVYPTGQIYAILDTVPAADVREVVHGKWYYGSSGGANCSACGFEADSAEASNYFNFCPNCGADMREVDDGT